MSETTQHMELFSSGNHRIDPAELEYMAFSGQFEQVYSLFKRIAPDERKNYANKYVLNQVVWGGIVKLRKFLAVQNEEAADDEKFFIDEVVTLFIDDCRKNRNFPREFFQTLLYWSDELVKLVLQDEAMFYIETALDCGCNKFPELQLQFLSRVARISEDKGNLREAYVVLVNLVSRPYLMNDRNLVQEILFDLSQTALKIGDTSNYKRLLFLGLRYFYTDMTGRQNFVSQIGKTYRKPYRVLLAGDVSPIDKLLFFIHWLYGKLPDFGAIKFGFINKFVKFAVLAVVYVINYLWRSGEAGLQQIAISESSQQFPETSAFFEKSRNPRSNFLITRAMGGIGDLLMMTPGIHALKQKYPGETIFLAIPKNYFSVFRNNPDVQLIDIENDKFDPSQFRKWFNFTDCPAARTEARTAPKVKLSRVEIFARALGVNRFQLKKYGTKPRYFIDNADAQFAEYFWEENGLTEKTVIGVQLQADETYRNYPHTEKLVEALSRSFTVLIFDAKPISGFHFSNVTKIDRFSIGQAFALAGQCDLLIAPDSAFVHLSAALDVHCVALFGPIDGKMRTKHYPLCEYLDASKQLGCVSCWRNETIPCKLTNMRTSVCMGDIRIPQILAAVNRGLRHQINEKPITKEVTYEILEQSV